MNSLKITLDIPITYTPLVATRSSRRKDLCWHNLKQDEHYVSHWSVADDGRLPAVGSMQSLVQEYYRGEGSELLQRTTLRKPCSNLTDVALCPSQLPLWWIS